MSKSVLILAVVCCFLVVSSSIGGALYLFRCDLELVDCPDEDQKGCPAGQECPGCPKIHDDIIRVESVKYNNSNKFLKVKLNLEENGNEGDTRTFTARFVPLGGGSVRYCQPAIRVNVKKDGIYDVDFSGIDNCFDEVSRNEEMNWAIIIHSQTYSGDNGRGDWKQGIVYGNIKKNVTR
jgi:hypothetical protein